MTATHGQARSKGRERALAVVLHLTNTSVFDADKGGQLVWCKPHTLFRASHNALTLFRVGPQSGHAVNMVQSASGARLALTGWFSTATARGIQAREAFQRRARPWSASQIARPGWAEHEAMDPGAPSLIVTPRSVQES